MVDWQREASRFQGLFAPRSAWQFLLFALLVVLLDQLGELLGAFVPRWLAFMLSIGSIGALFLAWWLLDRRQARWRSALVAFQAKREQPSAAMGLILLLSPFDPRDPALTREAVQGAILELTQKETKELSDDDFAKINLLDSNLRPQITAVNYHLDQGKLRDVWLIASRTTGSVRGSEEAAEILERFLRFKCPAIKVHRGVGNQDLVVEAWNYTTIWEQAEKIFRTAGYREEVLLADVTGGTKMMSVALAMACIPPRRRIQYMDSERDATGHPLSKGQIVPVIMDVDPILYRYTAGEGP